MSKNNYGEMVALLDWVTKNKKDKIYKRREKNMDFKAYMKFKKELEEFEKWEKSMLKKDIKQEQKSPISALHLAIFQRLPDRYGFLGEGSIPVS